MSRTIARNVRLFGVAQLVVRFSGIAVIVVMARTFSSADFGRYTVALALASLLTLVVELGMGGYLVREATQHPERQGTVLGQVLAIQGILGVLAALLCAGLAVVLGYDGATFLAAVILAVGLVGNIASRSCTAMLVAQDRAREVASFQSAQAFLLAGGTLLALLTGAGPAGVAAVVAGVYLLGVPAALATVRRRWTGKVRPSRAGLGRTLRIGAAYSAARLGIIALVYLDSVMVQAYLGNEAAARYGAAYRLLQALMIVPWVYADAISRPLADLAKHDRDALQRLYSRSVAHMVMLGLPIAVGGALLAEPVMRLAFGPPYAEAAGAATLLLLGLACAYPNALLTATALGVGQERRVAVNYASAVLANAALNIVLIPQYGIEGAAAAMLLAQVWIATGNVWAARRAGLRAPVSARLLKPVGATAVMTAAVLLLRDLPLLVPVAAGALVYGGLLAASRALDAEDLAMLPGPWGRSPARSA